jgi:hypothetical protein
MLLCVCRCSSSMVPRYTTVSPTYRSGPFELLEEPRHGERRGDQAPEALMDRWGWWLSI